MPKISFNTKALSLPVDTMGADVSSAFSADAFYPVVSLKTGFEAVMEVLRFPDIEGFKRPEDR